MLFYLFMKKRNKVNRVILGGKVLCKLKTVFKIILLKYYILELFKGLSKSMHIITYFGLSRSGYIKILKVDAIYFLMIRIVLFLSISLYIYTL